VNGSATHFDFSKNIFSSGTASVVVTHISARRRASPAVFLSTRYIGQIYNWAVYPRSWKTRAKSKICAFVEKYDIIKNKSSKVRKTKVLL
jgi:hypothetical protein